MTGSDEYFDQLFFQWRETGGLAVRTSSRPQDEDETWNSWLGGPVRMEPFEGVPTPPVSWVYCTGPRGWTAVLRRSASGDAPGRNDAMALISPSAGRLDPRIAMCASAWYGWTPPINLDRAMYPVLRSQVEDAVRACADEHREWGECHRELAARVLAHLLERPREPLSLIHVPAADRLGLLWALRAAGHHWLRREGITRQWTFPTWEVRHDASAEPLPETVFLPGRPVDLSSVHRNVVDLTAAAPADDLLTLAHHLVRLWIEEKPLLDGVPRLAELTAHPPSTATPPAEVPATQRDDRAAAGTGDEVSGGGKVAVGVPPPATPEPPGSAPHDPGPRTVALDALCRASTVAAFSAALDALPGRTDPAGRGELRRGLADRWYQIGRFVEAGAEQDLAAALVAALFGPNGTDIRTGSDRSGPEQDAVTMIRGDAPLSVVRHLLVVVGNNRPLINAAVAGRVRIGDARRIGHEGRAVVDRLRRRVRRDHALDRRAVWSLAAPVVLVALVVLVVTFVVGLVIGDVRQSDPAQAPPAPTAPTASLTGASFTFDAATIAPGTVPVLYVTDSVNAVVAPPVVCTVADATWTCPAPDGLQVDQQVVVVETPARQASTSPGTRVPTGRRLSTVRVG